MTVGPADAVIRQYAQQYGIKYFIETGTSVGETTAALLADFHTIITIEIDQDLYEQAKVRFAGYEHVHCLHGDSSAVLAANVPGFVKPCIFWLDGHYSGGPGRGDIDTPISDELAAAVFAPKGSVVLIDDARLFGGGPEHTEEFKDYPTIEWVQAAGEVAGFDFELRDDIMRLTPPCGDT